ncbi:MAG: type IV toxin-antitoxin system AbiEi family antitoxin [Candidatus Delongbacteria bacterium]|nr:type IV toxin-antitoxin system AbiEi family antitoxin [Candidatus Delongbacteria bacterium]
MTKIKNLISKSKKGMILTSVFLKNEGISPDLVKKYLNSGWLDKVGNQAYILQGDQVDIFSATYSLQSQLKKTIRVGGKSALSYLGYAHFLAQRTEKIYLFGKPEDKLPVWFKRYEWDQEYIYQSPNLFNIDLKPFFNEYTLNGITASISGAELAMFEMLYLVPSSQTFQESFLIVENLRTLRSDVLQVLLENCNSVKVKRLAMYMLEENEQSYFKKLDLSKIDLGSGNRVIEMGGILDKKYKITVPRDLNDR